MIYHKVTERQKIPEETTETYNNYELNFVSKPSPAEELRVLKICYKEDIIISVACRGDAWDVNRRLRTKNRSYIIQYSTTLKKSVSRSNSHVWLHIQQQYRSNGQGCQSCTWSVEQGK